MQKPMPICLVCKHYQRTPGSSTICNAFPEEIPRQIWETKADHRQLYPGDHGIRFEAISAEDAAFVEQHMKIFRDGLQPVPKE